MIEQREYSSLDGLIVEILKDTADFDLYIEAEGDFELRFIFESDGHNYIYVISEYQDNEVIYYKDHRNYGYLVEDPIIYKYHTDDNFISIHTSLMKASIEYGKSLIK